MLRPSIAFCEGADDFCSKTNHDGFFHSLGLELEGYGGVESF